MTVSTKHSLKTPEEYKIVFWHHSFESGFWQQKEESFWAEDKSSHEEVFEFAKKHLSKTYRDVNIVSVIYQ